MKHLKLVGGSRAGGAGTAVEATGLHATETLADVSGVDLMTLLSPDKVAPMAAATSSEQDEVAPQEDLARRVVEVARVLAGLPRTSIHDVLQRAGAIARESVVPTPPALVKRHSLRRMIREAIRARSGDPVVEILVAAESGSHLEFRLCRGASITARFYSTDVGDDVADVERVVGVALEDLAADMAKYPA